ncbi:MAG: biosynthetic-type acetolactate synthase large subunit [Desulfurococcales archaeon]|nr:biosynthetic-type acetolactate synthase large subunit [Desulfurococcales archaeon]
MTGGSIMGLFDALALEDFDIYMFRHEQGAAHAADAYGRVKRRPGIVLATSGPGATNLVTGIANAYFDSAPMLAITGQVPTSVFGRDAFQETDIVGVTAPITKFNYQIRKPGEVGPVLRTAYRLAYEGRPGPVLVDFPRDVQLARYTCGEEPMYLPIVFSKYRLPEPDIEAVRKAARLLAMAFRPVILVGNGVYWSGAWPQVLRLAEILQAPIVTTLPGKNAVPADHRLVMGPAGMHGRLEADAALANADVVLAVGTRFSDRTVGRFSPEMRRMKVIHIDSDPSELGKNVESTIGIVADAKTALDALLREIPSVTRRDSKFLEWLNYIRRRYEDAMERWSRRMKKFAPWKVLKAVREVAPRDTITVTGVGSHQMWAEQHWDVYVPGSWITSAGLGTMGFCVPAALGAKIAARDRPVLCIDGDGSFQMTMNNLALVRDYNLPITVLIFDNRALMLVKHWQIFFYDRRIVATEYSSRPDFAKIAEAYDIEAVRPVDLKEVQKWVSWSIRNNEPIIVVIEVDSEEDLVLPWVKPGEWLANAVKPPTLEDLDLTYDPSWEPQSQEILVASGG